MLMRESTAKAVMTALTKFPKVPTDTVTVTFQMPVAKSLSDEHLKEWILFSFCVGGINSENPMYDPDDRERELDAEYGTVQIQRNGRTIQEEIKKAET